MRIAYLATAPQQYLRGLLREVRRSYPETDLKLVNLSPGEQIAALRAGEIDIGITSDNGKLLGREFYTRTLAEMGSSVALSEQHRLATRDQVRLSDLKGEFFLGWGAEQVPGWQRQIEEYCKKFGKFRPNFHGEAKSLAHAFELVANENTVLCYWPLPNIFLRLVNPYRPVFQARGNRTELDRIIALNGSSQPIASVIGPANSIV